jgi:hypothetical protein
MRALRGRIDACGSGQDRPLTLRYGVGPRNRVPRAGWQGCTTSPHRQYALVQRRALRELVRAAHAGACDVGGGEGAQARPDYPTAGPGGIGSARRRRRGLGWRGEGSDRRAWLASGPRRAAGARTPQWFSTPLAVDAEQVGGSMIAMLVFMATLAGLAVIALRPLLAAARRGRGDPSDV